jgi:hypothetical protein
MIEKKCERCLKNISKTDNRTGRQSPYCLYHRKYIKGIEACKKQKEFMKPLCCICKKPMRLIGVEKQLNIFYCDKYEITEDVRK